MNAPPQKRAARRVIVGLVRSGRLPALFAAFACAATIYGFLASSDYQVDTVLVQGVRNGDPNQVASAAGVLDHSIFRIDPDDAARAIARLPWVEGTSVRLETPDTLVVELVERVPVAVWSSGGRTVLVDADGQVLFTGDAPDLPRVVDDGANLAPGDAVAALDVAAIQAIDQAFGAALAQLAWHDDIGFEATLADERIVVFGDATRMQLKFAALAAFVPRSNADWTYLDLSEPERPYFR